MRTNVRITERKTEVKLEKTSSSLSFSLLRSCTERGSAPFPISGGKRRDCLNIQMAIKIPRGRGGKERGREGYGGGGEGTVGHSW